MSERQSREPPDPSVTIDLSRKKVRRASLAGAQRLLEVPREEAEAYTSVLRIAFEQLKKSRLARSGALVVACLAMIAVLADALANDLPIACKVHGTLYLMPNVTRPAALAGWDCARVAEETKQEGWAVYPLLRYGPSQMSGPPLRPPGSGGHALGTDARGRDVVARLVHGTRTALGVALLAVIALAAIGAGLGAIGGYFGGILDAVIARLVEALTAFPTLVLVLVIQALLPHPTVYTLLAAIALTRWTEVARLVRAEVLLVAQHDYVTAARAIGAGPWRILRRHVMPNAVAPALVAATFGIASVVLIEASLDFLRAGVPETIPSWGEMLSEARDHTTAWWLVAFPGLLVFSTVVALNLMGEALRDALDPRLRDAVRSVESVQDARTTRDTVVPPTAAAIDDSTHA